MNLICLLREARCYKRSGKEERQREREACEVGLSGQTTYLYCTYINLANRVCFLIIQNSGLAEVLLKRPSTPHKYWYKLNANCWHWEKRNCKPMNPCIESCHAFDPSSNLAPKISTPLLCFCRRLHKIVQEKETSKMNGDDVISVSTKGGNATPSKVVSTQWYWNENPNEHTTSENLYPYIQIGHSSVSSPWTENFQKLTPHPDFQ